MLETIKDMLLPLALPAAMFGIHFYFQSRQSKPVGRVEHLLATVWLWIRRVMCFAAAGLCVLGAIFAIYEAITSSVSLMTPIGIALSLAMAGLSPIGRGLQPERPQRGQGGARGAQET